MIAAAATVVFGAGMWLAAATLAEAFGQNRNRILRALGGLA